MDNNTHLQEILSTKTAVLQRIKQLTQDLTAIQTDYHSSDGSWSISEIMEHLATSESQMLQLIESMLKKTEKAGKTASGMPSSEISFRAIFEPSKDEKYKARNEFLPTGKLPILVSLQMLQDIQTKLHELKTRLESVDLTYAEFPHWIFGRLNLGQWLALMGSHEERHLAQIKTILASNEYKQAVQQP